MRTRLIRTLSLAPLTVLLGGCAGYNHTLFMTKSNVGLDFDSKPPTAEVSISRKEAVIAPAFEGGQTPPVMASFKPTAGAGSSFFLGVDQTFAGGDAAVAMSRLYDSPESSEDISEFDSTLPLTKPPRHAESESGLRRFFFGLLKPGETRPFIFGTDTMLGAKVAWSGTGGQFPDTVRAGFNRKEFAWAPVTIAPNTDASSIGAKMPSFLATIESSQTISNRPGLKIEALQYFATGEAATRLAVQPEVRRAMLRRVDPNAQKQAMEYERLKTNAEDQQKSLERIVNVFEDSDAARQQRILDRAKSDGLVPADTTRDSFVDVLVSRANLTDDALTTKLNSLVRALPSL
jgi:hypothetical protein